MIEVAGGCRAGQDGRDCFGFIPSADFFMPFVPLPFVVAILLIVLFCAVVWRDDERAASRPFLALILVSAFLSILSGLRWGYGVNGALMILAPLGAATVPPLAYAGVTELVRKSRIPLKQRLLLYAVPALIIVALLPTWRGAIDVALVLIFVCYAVAILLLMRPGTDALRLAPFEGAAHAYRAIIFAAVTLLISAGIDTFVFLDLAWMQGAYVRPVIAVGNLASLIILSIAAATASQSHSVINTAEMTLGPEVQEDTETLPAIEALMEAKRVYRDVDLNLDRLARKLGIPARQISSAINRAAGKNVSQYVNEYRIAEACRLLAETSKPVTEIMFDVGFQTKSNFNREFRRVTDMTPLQWRERNAEPSSNVI